MSGANNIIHHIEVIIQVILLIWIDNRINVGQSNVEICVFRKYFIDFSFRSTFIHFSCFIRALVDFYFIVFILLRRPISLDTNVTIQLRAQEFIHL